MKKLRVTLCALAALTSWVAFGQVAPNDQLIFTEWNKNTLTAELNGNPFGTVANFGENHWIWSLKTFPIFRVVISAGQPWSEPPPETGYNVFAGGGVSGPDVLSLGFDSDVPSVAPLVPVANGEIGFTLTIEFLSQPDSISRPPLIADVIFRDMGDATSVPEITRTSGLLIAALMTIVTFKWRIQRAA